MAGSDAVAGAAREIMLVTQIRELKQQGDDFNSAQKAKFENMVTLVKAEHEADLSRIRTLASDKGRLTVEVSELGPNTAQSTSTPTGGSNFLLALGASFLSDCFCAGRRYIFLLPSLLFSLPLASSPLVPFAFPVPSFVIIALLFFDASCG